jgi:hypothetical protein
MRVASPLRLLLAMLLVLVGLSARAETTPSIPSTVDPSDDVPDITLLTFGPGPIYWERFGHNAILVHDHRGDFAYNYGVFDFSEKSFFLNFARGRMSYRISADPVYLDLRFYNQEGRWIVAQHLDMTPAQRVQLRDFLLWNAQPDNMRYEYDYFISNCSTRVRDALDHVLDGAIRQQLEKQTTATSYRSEALRLISPDRWLMLSMDLALGPTADLPLNLQQQSFVPMVLKDAVRGVQITDPDGRVHPLVDKERQIVPGRLPDAPVAAPDLLKPFFLLGLVTAAVLLRLTRTGAGRSARSAGAVLATAVTLVCGIGGLVLVLLWAATDHWAGWRNENLLLFNPLCLLLIPAAWGLAKARLPSARTLRTAQLIAAGALLALLWRAIPALPHQDNLKWIALLLPTHFVIAFSLWQSGRSNG